MGVSPLLLLPQCFCSWRFTDGSFERMEWTAPSATVHLINYHSFNNNNKSFLILQAYTIFGLIYWFKKQTKNLCNTPSIQAYTIFQIDCYCFNFFYPAGIHSRVKCWGSSTRRRPKRSLPVAAWAWATWCTLWCPTQPTSARPSSWRPCPATPSTCPTPMPTMFPQPMWKGCPARWVFVQSWRKVGSALMGPPRRSPAVCWNSRTCWNMPTSTTHHRLAASPKWRNRWTNWSMKRTLSAGSCRAWGTLLLGLEEHRGSQRNSRISRVKNALSPSVANPAPTCLPPRVPFQSLCGNSSSNSSSSSHPSSLEGWVCCRQLRASTASHLWRTTNSSSRCHSRWTSWAPCLAPLHSPTFTATTGPTPPSRPPAATATTRASLRSKATPLSCPWPRSRVGSSLSLWPAPARSPRPARLLRPRFPPRGGPSVAATAALPRPFPTLFPPPAKALGGGAASLVLVADLRKQHTASLSFLSSLVSVSWLWLHPLRQPSLFVSCTGNYTCSATATTLPFENKRGQRRRDAFPRVRSFRRIGVLFFRRQRIGWRE